MTYLYAGLGVALLVPLMALVQTLISVAQLDREGNDLALLQNQYQIDRAKKFASMLPAKINESTACVSSYYGVTFESGCSYIEEIPNRNLKLRVELSLLKSQFQPEGNGSLKKDLFGFYVPKNLDPLVNPVNPVTHVDVKSCWVSYLNQDQKCS